MRYILERGDLVYSLSTGRMYEVLADPAFGQIGVRYYDETDGSYKYRTIPLDISDSSHLKRLV